MDRDANAQLNPQARLLLERASRLAIITNENTSKRWELEYRCNDLADEVRRLKAQLRDSVPLSDPTNPAQIPATSLEVSLQNRVVELKSKIRKVEQRLAQEISRNWELTYQCQDQREEISRLKTRLRNQSHVNNEAFMPGIAPTALEKLLEERVRELEDQIRYGVGRARSKSI